MGLYNIDNEDIKLEFVEVKDWPNIPKRGVILTHMPTKIKAKYNLDTSSLVNYEKAYKELAKLVKELNNNSK